MKPGVRKIGNGGERFSCLILPASLLLLVTPGVVSCKPSPQVRARLVDSPRNDRINDGNVSAARGQLSTCRPRNSAFLADLVEGSRVTEGNTSPGFALQGAEQGLVREFQFSQEGIADFQIKIAIDPTTNEKDMKNIRIFVSTRGRRDLDYGTERALTVNTIPGHDAELNRFSRGTYISFFSFDSPAESVRVRMEGVQAHRLKDISVRGELALPHFGLSQAISAYMPPGYTRPPSGFRIIPRAEWTQVPPRKAPDTGHWKKIVIHHSSVVTKNISVGEQHARAYLTSHMEENGWDDIGYHFLVAPDGRVFEGRKGGKNIVGAHTLNFNVHTVGINIMGQFETSAAGELGGVNTPTTEAINAAARLVAWLSSETSIDLQSQGTLEGTVPGVTVPALTTHLFLGSNDAKGPNATDCPGDRMIARMENLRELSLKYLAEIKAGGGNTVGIIPTPTAVADRPVSSENPLRDDVYCRE